MMHLKDFMKTLKSVFKQLHWRKKNEWYAVLTEIVSQPR